MRATARARVKCLVGLVVAVGLVSLLSPLPFTSPTPRVKESNRMQPQVTPNPFIPAETRGEDARRENSGYKLITGVENENSGVKEGRTRENGENIGGTERESGKRENWGKESENQGEMKGNQGGEGGIVSGGREKESGNQQIVEMNGNINSQTGEAIKSSGVLQVNFVDGESVKLKKEKEEEEEEEEEEGPLLENIPPEDWVEVKKTKPKKEGGGGGGEGGGKTDEELGKEENGGIQKSRKEIGGKDLNGSKKEEYKGREEVKEDKNEGNKGKEEGKRETNEGNKGKEDGKGDNKRKENGKTTNRGIKGRRGGGGVGSKRKTKGARSYEKPVGPSAKDLQRRAASLPASSPVHAFLAEQQRRAAHIASSCRSFQPSLQDVVAGSRGPPMGLLAVRDIIFDTKNQLTFCPVYKAASTSLTIMLLELGGHWNEHTKSQQVQKLVKMFYPKLSGLSAASITANTTHFMVVRHPLERLLSCYRDKYQLASKDYYYHILGEKMVRLYRPALQRMSAEEVLEMQEEVRLALIRHRQRHGDTPATGEFISLPHNPFANPVGPTFPEFAQFVVSAKNDDEHWRTYVAHCAPCTLTYDFVLRFESLQEETSLFLEYLNRTGEVETQWANHNRREETGEVFCQYYAQLPLELIDRLVQKYRRDLMMYEYDVEEYRKCASDYKSGDDGDDDGDGVKT